MTARGAARARPRGRRSALRALGAALLAISGFGLGLVAGAAWEEPTLVAHHVLGRTRVLELAGQAPPAVEVQPAPGQPSTPLGAPSDPAPRAGTRPTPRTQVASGPPSAPAAAAPRAGPGFAVQVGAFGEAAQAERLRERLVAMGLPVYVEQARGAGGPSWRVRVGPLRDSAEAERVAQRLKREQQLPTWIVSAER